jgi:Protein affecting phage T7 exclusion by the F plasmid
MSTVIFAVVLALPFLDIASLIKAGALLGFFPTVALVIASILIGSWLVQHQGLAIGRSVRETIAAGRPPVVEAFNGACLLIAGGLFLFPGFASDLVAVALLLPPVRDALRRLLARRLREQTTTVVWTTGADGVSRPVAGGDVIEGDFEVVRPANEPANTSASDPSERPSGKMLPPPKIVRPTDPC